METRFIVEGLIGITCLFMFIDLMKPKPVFGIQYKIKEIRAKNVVLENVNTRERLKVTKSFLYEQETFSTGDIVQMQSIWIYGGKTHQKLRRI